MTSGIVTRIFLATMITQCIALFGFTAAGNNAYGGTQDKSGNNAEIYSITITPDSTPAGTYPEIKGFARNTSVTSNGNAGSALFDVTAVITAPNGSQKSLVWNNVRFSAGQRKSYTCVNSYDIKQTGTYKVEYTVYNVGKTHLYASLVKSFAVVSPAAASKPVQTPSRTEKAAEPVKKAEQPKKPSSHERSPKAGRDEERKYVGIGGYVNALNFSGGPTFVLWPLKNIALQGTYGVGTFTSYEARLFYRFPLSESWKPYFGAGYIHSERKATVIGLDTKITGGSYTVFGGVEVPLFKNIFGYIDVSGTPLKLKKDVVNGSQAATVTVEYSPVTICTGLVFYLF